MNCSVCGVAFKTKMMKYQDENGEWVEAEIISEPTVLLAGGDTVHPACQ